MAPWLPSMNCSTRSRSAALCAPCGIPKLPPKIRRRPRGVSSRSTRCGAKSRDVSLVASLVCCIFAKNKKMMKTIFDANISRQEFDALFGDTGGVVTYENYLALGYEEEDYLYHLSLLFDLRGDSKRAKKFRQRSGMPPASQFVDCDR